MRILVLNPGSSTLKFSLYETTETDPHLLQDGEHPDTTPIAQILESIAAPPDAIGYRVVHPGPYLRDHARITPQLLNDLSHAISFAPLHDPAVLGLIAAGTRHYPNLPHYACFDTVFHQTMPAEATTYPIPRSFRDNGVHRYGFHGLSCESTVHQLRTTPGLPFPRRLLIAHLGSGCSITALVDGKSIDTSMGLTPTGGVVMGTRPGDLDPGLIFYLLRQPGATIDSVEALLNHQSGLKALGGINDMRKLRAATDPDSAQAITIFINSIRRTLGGMVALHGLDALVFTGGIGEHDPKTRWALGNGLRRPNLVATEINEIANEYPARGLRKISEEDAPYSVFVVPAEEDLIIASHVARMASNGI